MGTRRLHLLTNLRRRLGFYVGRPWRSKERLHLPLEPMYADSDYVGRHWDDTCRHSGDLVHVLGGSDRTFRRDSADSGPRSFTASSIGTQSKTWPMASSSQTITVSFNSAARYSDCE